MAGLRKKRRGEYTAEDIDGLIRGNSSAVQTEDRGIDRLMENVAEQNRAQHLYDDVTGLPQHRAGSYTAQDIDSLIRGAGGSTAPALTGRVPERDTGPDRSGLRYGSIGQGVRRNGLRGSEDHATPGGWSRVAADLGGVKDQMLGSVRMLGQMVTDPEVWQDIGTEMRMRSAELGAQELRARSGLVDAGDGTVKSANPELEAFIEQMLEREQQRYDEYNAGPKKVYTEENSPGMKQYMEGSRAVGSALRGVDGPARLLAETGNSMVTNAPGMALGLVPVVGPVAGLGLMGAQAAGGRAAELSAKGTGAAEALGRGTLSGAIEVATEVLPVGNWADIVKGSGKSVLRNVLSQMGAEGSEEIASYVANYIADRAAQDPDAEFSLEELANSALMGALSGGAFGVMGTAINRVARGPGRTTYAPPTQEELARTPLEVTGQQEQQAAPAGPVPPQQAAQAALEQEQQEQQEQREAPTRRAEAMPAAAEAAQAQMGPQTAQERAQVVERAATGDPAAMAEAQQAFEAQRAGEQAEAEAEAQAAAELPAAAEEAVQRDPRFAADESVTLTPAQQVLYQSGSEAGMSGQAAQRMAMSWDGSTDAQQHASAWQQLYRAGQLGLTENAEQAARMTGDAAQALDAQTRQLAFGQGQAEAAVYRFSEEARAQGAETVRAAAQANERFTDEMRQTVTEGYRGGSPTVYMQAMQGMYDAGRTGAMTAAQAMRANSGAVGLVGDAALLRRAYDLGAGSVQAVTDAPGRAGAAAGSVRYEGGAQAGATQVPGEVLDAAAARLGVDVRVVQRLTDAGGSEVNGHWAAALSELAVGENSGNAYQTVAHELTHYLGSYNAEGWARLRGAVLGWYAGERGMANTQSGLLDRYAQTYGDDALAADEAARDLWAGILSSEEGTRSFLEYLQNDAGTTVAEKRSILQTLRDVLDRMLESIRALLRGGDATLGAAEGRRLAERADQLENSRAMVQEFLTELETARRNAQGTASEAQQQNTAAGEMPAAASEDVRFQLPEGYESLEQKMNRAIPEMRDMEPVSTVDLKDARKEGKTPLEIEREYFAAVGGSVYNKTLGTVLLTVQGARNDVRHGISPVKMATLYAVPDVIRKGKIFDFQQEWKGRNYNSHAIMAPVTVVQGKVAHRTYVAAIVREYLNDGKKAFYLHEVLDADGNRVQFAKENETSLFNKTGPLAEDSPASKDTIGEVSNNTIAKPGADVKRGQAANGREGDIPKTGEVTPETGPSHLKQPAEWSGDLSKERTPLFSEGGPLAEGDSASKDTAGGAHTNTIAENGEDVKHSRPVAGEDSQPVSERLEEARRELRGSLYAHTGTKNSSITADTFGRSGAGTLGRAYGSDTAVRGGAAVPGRSSGASAVSVSGPTSISIRDLLHNVNAFGGEHFAGVLSKDVQKRLGGAAVSDFGDEVRYSRQDGDDARTQLERENRALAQQVSRMEEQVERLRQEMQLSKGHVMSPAAVDELAGRLLRQYESGYDRAQLTREITRLFESIANDPDASYADAMQTATSLIRDVLSASRRVNTELRDYYRPVREALRSTTIEVQEGSPVYHDLLYALGDGEGGAKWGNVRRATFGRLNLKLVQGPGNADTVFAELAEMFPTVFDADVAASNNIQQALGVFEASEPVYENPYGMDLDTAAAFAGEELFEAYMQTPERHTYADRQAQKLARLRGEYREQRQQALEVQKTRYERKLAEVKAQSRQRMGKLRQQSQAKLAKTQAEMRDQNWQRMGKLRQQSQEKLAQTQAELREQSRQRVEAVRSQMNDKLLAQKAAFEARMELRNEGLRWRQDRDGVQRSVRRLQRWLQSPTDQAHVQERMRKAVLDLLTSFDWDTSRAGSASSARWQEAMKDLRALALEMDNEKQSSDMEYVDFDPDLPAMISELVQSGRDVTRIDSFSADQMRRMREVLETVSKSITDANKLMAGAHARDLAAVGDATVQQLEEAKKRQLRTRSKLVGRLMSNRAVDTLSGLAGLDMMDAGSYFASLGEAGNSIYKNIREGFDKRVFKLRAAQEYMEGLLKGQDVKSWTGPKAQKRSFLGGKLELTVGQVMELYALTQRRQAHEHLVRGGISVDLGGGKKTARVQLTAEDLAEITGSLTPAQVKVVQAMQQYLSTEVAGWGNEVSMAQYGTRKFREANYWPIRTDSNFTRTSDASENPGGLWGIKNQGFTKATQMNANNPVILHDAFDTWSDHVANMATYNAWCIPLSDAMKWYNWRSPDGGVSVKEALEGLYGSKGKTYFVNLMKDINGTSGRANPTSTERVLGALVPRWKVAKVGANLRVAIQQPTAYLRAGAVISPKYLAAALGRSLTQVRRGMQEAERYCAIAQWKGWGYFETNVGQSMKSVLTGQQTLLEQIQDKSMILAELGDRTTWGTLWLACEAEVQERRPELAAGSEEFRQAVAARLSEVIDKTQVVDTVLHRSQVMRSKNQVVQMEMNFMAEPTKTWNLLRAATVDLAQGKVGSRAKFARTLATFTLTAMGTAAAAGLVDAMRVGDDDRDKDFMERYLAALQANFVDGVNVLSNLPLFKSILSIAEGYDVERTDMEAVSDFIDAANTWMKTMQGKGTASYYRLLYKTANVIAELTGLPVGGLVREAKSAYDMVTAMQDPLHLDEQVNKGNADLHRALANGDMEHAQELLDTLTERKISDGKTAKEARSSMRSSLTSYWKPLYVAGDAAARREIADKLLALRCNGEAIYTQKDLDKWLK